MNKDDGQIFKTNGDQEQRENKLPSKRTRRPPTTRYDDFLWPDISVNH